MAKPCDGYSPSCNRAEAIKWKSIESTAANERLDGAGTVIASHTLLCVLRHAQNRERTLAVNAGVERWRRTADTVSAVWKADPPIGEQLGLLNSKAKC